MELAEEFSEISATNLNELCLKARYVDPDSFPDLSCIAESIINDLLAIDGKRSATVLSGRSFASCKRSAFVIED